MCFLRKQNAVTLSFCEAELVAVQTGTQEGVGLVQALTFALQAMGLLDMFWLTSPVEC